MFAPVIKTVFYQFRPTTTAGSTSQCGWNHRRSPFLAMFCVPVLSLISACDSHTGNNLSGQLSNGELSLSLPSRLRDARAVNPNAVIATATVNNLDFPLTRTDNGSFQTSISIDANQTVTMSISFSETLSNGAVIELASHPEISRDIGSSNATIEFSDDNYQTNFDRDADGCDNLSEREIETNPLVDDSFPTGFTRTVSFTLPEIIPDPQLTRAIVAIAGQTRAVTRIGNAFQSSGALQQCSNASITVFLRQDVNANQLTLATASVPHGTTSNIALTDADFDFNEDADGDGRINVTELRDGTNPFVQD